MEVTKTKLPTGLELDDSFVQLNGKFSEGLLYFVFNKRFRDVFEFEARTELLSSIYFDKDGLHTKNLSCDT